MDSCKDICKALDMKELYPNICERFPHLHFTATDLKSPKMEFVLNLLKEYLQYFGVTIPPHFKYAIPAQDFYPEVFADVFPVIYMNILHMILKENSFDELNLRDLTDPSPMRTQVIFGVLENFSAFFSTKYINFEQKRITLNQIKDEYLHQISLRDNMVRKFNQRAQNRAQRDTMLKKMKEDHQLMEKEINNLIAKQKENTALDLEYHAQLQQAKQNYETLSETARNVYEENVQLKRQIVPDPENILKEHTRLEELLQQKVEELEGLNGHIHVMKANAEQYLSIVDCLHHQSKLLKDINSTMSILKKTNNSSGKLHCDEAPNSEEIAILETKIAKEQNAIVLVNDDILRRRVMVDSKSVQYKKSMTSINEELTQMTAKNESSSRRYSKLEKEVAKSSKEKSTILQIREKTCQHFEDKYESHQKEERSFFITANACLKSEINRLEMGLRMDGLDIHTIETDDGKATS